MYDNAHQEIRARLTLLNAPQDAHIADGTYNIYKFTGEESLGKPYVYQVSFMSPTLLNVEQLADTDVKILLQDEKDSSKVREIFGKVYKTTHSDSVGDKHLYTFTVVHPLFYLGLNQRYEIFQEQSAFEVIQNLLGRYAGLLDIDFNTNINPDFFIKREYTTQYKQSDLDFIQMLCEQEGVTLHMETGVKPYKVRLAHINETFTTLNDELRCNFNQSKAFSSTHTKENYFDFRMPTMEYLQKTGASPLAQSLTDNPYSAQLREALAFETQHDRLENPRPTNLTGYMTQRSKSNYADTEKIVGKSQSLEAVIGSGGTLFDTKAVKRTESILTKVTYDATFPNALEEYAESISDIDKYQYEVAFEATPVGAAHIPNYKITKPIIPSSVTALVSDGSDKAGLPGKANTIDVDELGRIRVIFHFDSKYPTSCYIRFANFSSGDGWGSQFIPRVNTEVIVNFLNGDPDRPVAIGSLYNGNNKIPKPLPTSHTQSYIKTQSMPGGPDNFNLLLFEDKGGSELVHMQAELNHLLHVKNDSDNNIDHDERATIGNDRTENVGHDEKITIGNDRTESVGNNEDITIGANRTEKVMSNETITIMKKRTEDVYGNEEVTIHKHRREKVIKNKFVTVMKNVVENVLMFKMENVLLGKSLNIGGAYNIIVGAMKNETVVFTSSETVGQDKFSTITKKYTLDVGEEIILKTGSSSLVMKQDGTIELSGINVKIAGSEHVEICSAIIDIN